MMQLDYAYALNINYTELSFNVDKINKAVKWTVQSAYVEPMFLLVDVTQNQLLQIHPYRHDKNSIAYSQLALW